MGQDTKPRKFLGYILCMMAHKHTPTGSAVSSRPGFTTKAKQDGAAKIIGLSLTLDAYPEEEGWKEHTCLFMRMEIGSDGEVYINGVSHSSD